MRSNNRLSVYAGMVCCLLACFAFIGCPGEDDEPDTLCTFYNHSGQELFYEYRYSSEPLVPADFLYDAYVIGVDEVKDITAYSQNTSAEQKLNILIYKQSTVDYYGWEAIKAQGIVDKQYILDADTLATLDYKIKYYGY